MIRRTVLILAVMLWTAPVLAQPSSRFVTFTIGATAVPMPPGTTTGMASCIVQFVGGSIRLRTDGVAPTSVIGMEIASGGTWGFASVIDALGAQFIRSGGVDVTANVSCTTGALSLPLAASVPSPGPAFDGVLRAVAAGASITDPTNLALRVNQVAGTCLGDTVQSAIIEVNVAGITQLVPASGSTVIRVCGIAVMSTSLVNTRFVTGTGVNCGTGTTNKTGNFPLNASRSMNTAFGAILFTGAAGEALCIQLGTADVVAGFITFTQQ